ncbi:MAG: DUF4097 domain-containing protein [bacterium]|nr:DUF4097 domain-containing protein [bacterium]
MRRTIFIFTLSLVVFWGFSNRLAAQERDSTEEELRITLDALGELKGLEGLKALEQLGSLEDLYGLEGLAGLEVLKMLGDLDLSSLDVAEEYLEILEQCRGMIEDYEDYLNHLDGAARKGHEVSVERIRRRLDDGSYLDDPDELVADLSEVIVGIKGIEKVHKAEMNSNSPRCCRVIRNLRREMVILVDLVEDYVDQYGGTVLGQDEIRKSMAEALREYVEALKETAEDRREAAEDIGKRYIVMPPSPRAPEPAPPVYVFPQWSQHKKGARGEVGFVRRFEDSLRVSSSRPVRIVNPAGGVQVTGWTEDFVSATLGIEISANTRAKERDFAHRTELLLSSEHEGYKVEARFPELHDPETKIIRCLLLVNIPENLQVESENSFGDVFASDLADGMVVNSRHSSVSLADIRGTVQVNNTMGEISLSDIKGSVTATTSYSPITLIGCDGTIQVENAYAAVSLTDTRGPVDIKNSGQITVKDHQGSLTISNAYGLVTLFDIEGDVLASNAYQPIEVSSVDGSVELDNLFSQIKISDISGSVTASNSNGMIQVEEPEGPVTLSNKNGSVTLVLDDYFSGASTVTTSHSTINLIVHEEPDLKITARVTDGKITSPFTYRVDTKGNSTDAEWVLGQGGNLLKIIGNNTDLVVRDH